MHPDYQPVVVDRIETMAKTGERVPVIEERFVRLDGTVVPVEVTAMPVIYDGKQSFLVIIRDISKRKAIEENLKQQKQELERSNRDLQQFAYAASHDLQEPLRMITGYIKLLEKKYKDKLDDEGREFMEFVINGAKRMQELITGLLTYSKVGGGERKKIEVDCNEVFDDTVKVLETMIKESGARITKDNLPTVYADPMEMRQLFQNLISNAIKFRRETPEIHVSAKKENNEWVFEIRDNGIGIDPKYASRIFDIFKRLHSREKYPGTGIGLAICKKIVECHHGRIWVESTPQVGSTFYFSIPVQRYET